MDYPTPEFTSRNNLRRSLVRSISVAPGLALFGLLLASGPRASAQDNPAPTLSNLTLSNLFSDGWDQPWAKRTTPGGAPDMALLRVSTNFLEREFRLDFLSEQTINSTKNRTINLFDGLIAYGLDRRIMVSVTSNYEWINSRGSNDVGESNVALGGRLQLIDIPGTSLALNLKATSPAKTLGNDFTTVAYSLAGWQDLTPYGLKKIGLYYSVQGNNDVGPHTIGSKSMDTSYDVSLAKTWTEPTSTLQNFTTFGELYSTTDLSGSFSGKTVVMLTPGIRTGIGLGQILMGGVDLPISHPRPYNWGLRLTYIINF